MTTALDLITTAEVAERLGGLHPSTISRWVTLGYMTPAMRVGTSMLFTREEVERRRSELEAKAAEKAAS